MTGAINLGWVTLVWVALDRIALLWYGTSHRGSSRTVARVAGTIRGGAVHNMAAVRIASVDRRRPEGLIPMWMLMSTRALLLRLIRGVTGWILDSVVILTSFAILQLDLTLDVG